MLSAGIKALDVVDSNEDVDDDDENGDTVVAVVVLTVPVGMEADDGGEVALRACSVVFPGMAELNVVSVVEGWARLEDAAEAPAVPDVVDKDRGVVVLVWEDMKSVDSLDVTVGVDDVAVDDGGDDDADVEFRVG